jgi:hypothetical protein
MSILASQGRKLLWRRPFPKIVTIQMLQLISPIGQWRDVQASLGTAKEMRENLKVLLIKYSTLSQAVLYLEARCMAYTRTPTPRVSNSALV